MKLTNILFVFLMFLAVGAIAQDYTTENLINNNNWTGAVYGADPNDCCSNPAGAGPLYDTTTGVIKFSYGNSYVGQTIGLQNALGGTGIQVNGYNYSFDYRLIPNSGTTIDYLYAQIFVVDAAGQAREITFHDLSDLVSLGTNDQWRVVSNTHTFAKPLLDPQSITIGFSGYDGGFWAGLYGPEVKNVTLSVNYGYDPCASDPLYSSSCPGYWEAFAQQLCASGVIFLCPSQSSVSITEIEEPLPTLTTTQPIQSVEQESTTSEVKVDAGGVEVSASGELTVPDNIPEEVKEKEKKEIDKNLIASIVREAVDNTETLNIVNQSIQDSLEENANPDFTLSATPNEDSTQQEANNELTNVSLYGGILDDPISEVIFLRINFSNITSDINETVEETVSQSNNTQTNNNSDIQQQTTITLEQTEDVKDEVSINQNAEPNDAAGGVDIASIAVTPTGFSDYLNKNLNDARFYEQKEVYKGQVVVDNARAQRFFSGASDRLHQEMVNEQYKR